MLKRKGEILVHDEREIALLLRRVEFGRPSEFIPFKDPRSFLEA